MPAALAISVFAPWSVTPLLMVGGAFLCYEGFEKLAHKFMHSTHEQAAEHEALTQRVANGAGAFLAGLTPLLMDALVGLVAGGAVLLLVSLAGRLRPRA